MRTCARGIAPAFLSSILATGLLGFSLPIAAGSPTFTLSPLLLTDGSSEPEISIGGDGTLAIVSLQWLFNPASYGTALWTGLFGTAPAFRGIVDNKLRRRCRCRYRLDRPGAHHNTGQSGEAHQWRTARRVGHHLPTSSGGQSVGSELHRSDHRHDGVRSLLDHL